MLTKNYMYFQCGPELLSASCGFDSRWEQLCGNEDGSLPLFSCRNDSFIFMATNINKTSVKVLKIVGRHPLFFFLL